MVCERDVWVLYFGSMQVNTFMNANSAKGEESEGTDGTAGQADMLRLALNVAAARAVLHGGRCSCTSLKLSSCCTCPT